MVYTSGTTGRARGTETRWVLAPVETSDDYLRVLRERAQFPPGAHIVVGPLQHNGPLAAVRHLLLGETVIIMGRFDAARALGLTPGRVVRLVVIPQAMPVIIPPITSQYLNLIKNSSFGAAIAYPEIVAVFMGSALVATGQAIEIIAITLGIYLTIGLAVSVFMNWYNARHKLVAR